MTVSIGNTELPSDAFVVSGFDVSGHISNDGLQNAEFVLFNQKNVSVKNPRLLKKKNSNINQSINQSIFL